LLPLDVRFLSWVVNVVTRNLCDRVVVGELEAALHEAMSEALKQLNAGRMRTIALFRSGLPAQAAVTGSAWSVRDVAAHLAATTDVYRRMASGEASPYTDPRDRAAVSQALIDAEPEQDLDTLADRIDAVTEQLAIEFSTREAEDPVLWHAGRTIPAIAHTGGIIGELLIHGRDVARTFRWQWPLPPESASTIASFMTAAAPLAVDAEMIGDLTVTVEVRLRRQDVRHSYCFANGTLTTALDGTDRADLRISADPVAWVLVGYGRSSPIVATLTGQIRPAGRPRPLLAWRLRSLMQAP
jgi:putative sterol carrier protein/uncharacterized damage-inducible protein DinB